MDEVIKGFKPLTAKMKSVTEDTHFKINVEYEIDPYIKAYKKGFSFYKKLEDICYHNYMPGLLIYEIEAYGKIEDDEDDRFCAEKIKLIRELNQEDIRAYAVANAEAFLDDDRPQHNYKNFLADYCVSLNKLVRDKNPVVRERIAENPSMTPKYLRLLSKDNTLVQSKVVQNPNCPTDLLDEIARGDNDLLKNCIINNKNTTITTLNRLYIEAISSNNLSLLIALSINDKISYEMKNTILEQMSKMTFT